MIKRKTTLILGAGASAPFEFPIGYELLRRVATSEDFVFFALTFHPPSKRVAKEQLDFRGGLIRLLP
jgi:hypothetical protein